MTYQSDWKTDYADLTPMDARDRIFKTLKEHPEWSDRRIARVARCSHPTVGIYRREFEAKTGEVHVVRLDKNKREINTGKIGKNERGWFRRWQDEWYTPHATFSLARNFYGGVIDLDPSSCAEANDDGKGGTWAVRIFTKEIDGLKQPWVGRVWCNPPYYTGLVKWVQKAVEECESGRATEIMMLTPHSHTSLWMHDLALPKAAICMLRKRLELRRPIALQAEAKRRGSPVVGDNLWGQDIVYFGERRSEFAQHFATIGTTVSKLTL